MLLLIKKSLENLKQTMFSVLDLENKNYFLIAWQNIKISFIYLKNLNMQKYRLGWLHKDLNYSSFY